MSPKKAKCRITGEITGKKPPKIANNAVISAFFTKVSPLQQSVPERSETVTASPCQGQLSLAQPATVSPCHEVITLTKSVIVCLKD